MHESKVFRSTTPLKMWKFRSSAQQWDYPLMHPSHQAPHLWP